MSRLPRFDCRQQRYPWPIIPSTSSTCPPERRRRGRKRTRAALLGAARQLFGEQGVEATRINDITEAADVGFGSFYNHFADKDAIVGAVLAELAEEHGSTVDRLTADVSDPAEVVSIALRYFVRVAAKDPTFAALFVRLEESHRVIAHTLGPRAARDIKSGRFTLSDRTAALHACGGALFGTLRLVQTEPQRRRADERCAELVLRMLGLTHAEAAEIASRTMPTPST